MEHFLLRCPQLDQPRKTLLKNMRDLVFSTGKEELQRKWEHNKLWFLYGSSEDREINHIVLSYIAVMYKNRSKLLNISLQNMMWGRNRK